MGTNYYAVQKRPSLYRTMLHLGKASAGWKFLFHGYMNNDFTIKSIEDWKNYIRSKDLVIIDEYDTIVNRNKFFKMVEDFQSNENPDNFKDAVNVEGYRFSFREFR